MGLEPAAEAVEAAAVAGQGSLGPFFAAPACHARAGALPGAGQPACHMSDGLSASPHNPKP